MRTLPLLAGLAMALALVSAAPFAAASVKTCSELKGEDCAGVFCIDRNGDGIFTFGECVDTEDADPCRHQSDCCTYAGSGLWCPGYEDS